MTYIIRKYNIYDTRTLCGGVMGIQRIINLLTGVYIYNLPVEV